MTPSENACKACDACNASDACIGYHNKVCGHCQYSLYEELEAYTRRGIYPFHMPGHKGNARFLPPVSWAALDVTELENTDNLHDPTGCIKETKRRIANLCGADESFLLINGSTSGIIAAIMATCDDGDVIAVDRNCHRSVYSGMVLSGAYPAYFWPGGLGFSEKARAVIVTSPTYEGNVLDIKKVAESAHRQGAILIVDEAHGAHFPLHEIFPKNALSQGADIVITSFHKTLPAFSQSAAVHVQGSRVNIGRLRQALSMIQTSSPSYLIMAATDYMLNKLQSEKSHFEEYVENLLALRKDIGNFLIPTDDISKLLINATNGRELEHEFKIAFELVTNCNQLAITTVADTKEGFDRLKVALGQKGVKGTSPLAGRLCAGGTRLAVSGSELCASGTRLVVSGSDFGAEPQGLDLPEIVLSPKESLNKKNKKTKTSKLSESIGEVSGGFIAPFPPGIPLLAPGERITESLVRNLADSFADCEIEILLL